MNRVIGAFLIVTALALTPALPALGQPAPRRLSFAEMATAAVQDNLQLRAASFDVAVAQAQLAQARAGKMPRATLSWSYARSQERPGQTLSFANPFGPSPSVITVTLPSPDPNLLVLRLGLQYPLYTGGRLESQIALADANLLGAQAVFQRTTQQIVFSTQQAYLVGLLAAENLIAAQRALEQATAASPRSASGKPGFGSNSSRSWNRNASSASSWRSGRPGWRWNRLGPS